MAYFTLRFSQSRQGRTTVGRCADRHLRARRAARSDRGEELRNASGLHGCTSGDRGEIKARFVFSRNPDCDFGLERRHNAENESSARRVRLLIQVWPSSSKTVSVRMVRFCPPRVQKMQSCSTFHAPVRTRFPDRAPVVSSYIVFRTRAAPRPFDNGRPRRRVWRMERQEKTTSLRWSLSRQSARQSRQPARQFRQLARPRGS